MAGGQAIHRHTLVGGGAEEARDPDTQQSWGDRDPSVDPGRRHLRDRGSDIFLAPHPSSENDLGKESGRLTQRQTDRPTGGQRGGWRLAVP